MLVFGVKNYRVIKYPAHNLAQALWAAAAGKAAKCRQKLCSSKRPPKFEPRSVRPNEVFENVVLALNNEELVKAKVLEKRVFEQTTPLK